MYSWYIFFKWLNWATFSSFKSEPPDHVVHIWHFKEKKEKTVCISFHFNISLVLVKTKTIFNNNSQSSQDFQAVTDQFCKWLAWNWSWRFTTKIVPAKLFSYSNQWHQFTLTNWLHSVLQCVTLQYELLAL